MGRKPSGKYPNLPVGMRARVRGDTTYYYLDSGCRPRKEISLGKNYVEAVRRWVELEHGNNLAAGEILTFRQVAERYMREVIPKKAVRTQRDNIKEIEWLMKVFDNPPAPLDEIRPVHIQAYLDWRGKTAKTRANREKSLFSHIWNKARSWGITEKPNPCAGIKGFTESGRDIYIEDDVYRTVWEAADQPLRDAMDLAYLTGQRPADTLAMSETDIYDGMLLVEQGKTGQKLRISIEGELRSLLSEIVDRKKNYRIHTLALVCGETGRALSSDALRSRFNKAREKAARNNQPLAASIRAFQFRDLRAKAGTDKSDSGGMREAQQQLGHKSMAMTEHYVRNRRGQKVTPTR